LTTLEVRVLYRLSLNRYSEEVLPVLLPILTRHARDLTATVAQSARPHAPVHPERVAPVAQRRSPGAARRAAAAVLRRSADRLAPMIE
jgi:hypothetical protein